MMMMMMMMMMTMMMMMEAIKSKHVGANYELNT